MVFRVFNGFHAGIPCRDTLLSCPYDNSAPDRQSRFSKEKDDVAYWMVLRVFIGFNAGISLGETLQSCPHEISHLIGMSDFLTIKRKWVIGCFFGYLMVLTRHFPFAVHYIAVRRKILYLIGISLFKTNKDNWERILY
jgi:hypothetical protein